MRLLLEYKNIVEKYFCYNFYCAIELEVTTRTEGLTDLGCSSVDTEFV